MLSLILGGPCFPTDKTGMNRILVGVVHEGIGLDAGPQPERIRAGDEGLGSDGEGPLQPRIGENGKKVLLGSPWGVPAHSSP